jgi:Leucine-rich repeat (LRR) protein
LSVELRELNQLKKLDLEDNKIANIQVNTFRDQKNLETMDLSNNNLVYLHLDLFNPLKNLHFLDLTGNKELKISPEYKNAIAKKIASGAEIDL